MNTVGLDYTSATKVIDLEMFGPSIVKGINENPHFTSNKFYITYCTVKFSVRTCPRKMKKGFLLLFREVKFGSQNTFYEYAFGKTKIC